MNSATTPLVRSLFGPAAAPRDCLVIGAVMGVVSGLGPLYESQPLLFFMPVAWLLYVLARMYSFIREPRKSDWAFCLGLSYENRRDLSLGFLRLKSVELGIVCAVAALAFLATRGVLYRDAAWGETGASAAIMFGEIVALFGALFLSVKLRLVRPSKNDLGMVRRLFSCVPALLRRTAGAPARRFSLSLPLLSYDQNIILRRQVLYCYRVSPFNALFFTVGGLVAYGMSLCLTPAHEVVFLCLASCVPPVVVLFALSPAMSDSAQKLWRCPYYFFPARDLFIVNALIASAVVAPYLIALFGKIVFFTHDWSLLTLLRLAAAGSAALSIILAFALRYGEEEWEGKTTALVGIVLVCAMLGVCIPYTGILFPLVAAALVLVLGR